MLLSHNLKSIIFLDVSCIHRLQELFSNCGDLTLRSLCCHIHSIHARHLVQPWGNLHNM